MSHYLITYVVLPTSHLKDRLVDRYVVEDRQGGTRSDFIVVAHPEYALGASVLDVF